MDGEIRFPGPDDVRPLRPDEIKLIAARKGLAEEAMKARKARRAIENALAALTAKEGPIG